MDASMEAIVANGMTEGGDPPNTKSRQRKRKSLPEDFEPRRTSRELRRVDSFQPSPIKSKPSSERKLQQGTGDELGKIVSVEAELNRLKADSKTLINMHRLMYKVPGAKLHRKGEIRIWQGVVQEAKEAEFQRMSRSLAKMTLKEIKDLAKMFGFSEPKKDELIKQLVEFLILPEIGKCKGGAAKGKRRRSISTKSSAKSNSKAQGSSHEKKEVSAFSLFLNERKKKDDASEASSVAEEDEAAWEAMTEAEKKPYEEKAVALKTPGVKDKKPSSKSRGAAGSKGAQASDSEEGDEEEEEAEEGEDENEEEEGAEGSSADQQSAADAKSEQTESKTGEGSANRQGEEEDEEEEEEEAEDTDVGVASNSRLEGTDEKMEKTKEVHESKEKGLSEDFDSKAIENGNSENEEEEEQEQEEEDEQDEEEEEQHVAKKSRIEVEATEDTFAEARGEGEDQDGEDQNMEDEGEKEDEVEKGHESEDLEMAVHDPEAGE